MTMLINKDVKTFFSFSLRRKNKLRLIINSALNKNDFMICGWDEMRNENNGIVSAIIYAFLFDVWISATTNAVLIGSR